MEEVMFLSLENPDSFFKDAEKTKKLYDMWKETMGVNEEEMKQTEDWRREDTIHM